jgi:hypothetical protein
MVPTPAQHVDHQCHCRGALDITVGDPSRASARRICSFAQERRRLRIIPNAFGERPVLKLMFGALIRAAERWRAVKVTEFERR